jgi:hypothetical protein
MVNDCGGASVMRPSVCEVRLSNINKDLFQSNKTC